MISTAGVASVRSHVGFVAMDPPQHTLMRRLIASGFTPSRVGRTMVKAADECITKVAGIDTVGPQVVRHENTSLLTQMIADLEARFTEPAAG
jgi:cytochrome P450